MDQAPAAGGASVASGPANAICNSLQDAGHAHDAAQPPACPTRPNALHRFRAAIRRMLQLQAVVRRIAFPAVETIKLPKVLCAADDGTGVPAFDVLLSDSVTPAEFRKLSSLRGARALRLACTTFPMDLGVEEAAEKAFASLPYHMQEKLHGTAGRDFLITSSHTKKLYLAFFWLSVLHLRVVVTDPRFELQLMHIMAVAYGEIFHGVLQARSRLQDPTLGRRDDDRAMSEVAAFQSASSAGVVSAFAASPRTRVVGPTPLLPTQTPASSPNARNPQPQDGTAPTAAVFGAPRRDQHPGNVHDARLDDPFPRLQDAARDHLLTLLPEMTARIVYFALTHAFPYDDERGAFGHAFRQHLLRQCAHWMSGVDVQVVVCGGWPRSAAHQERRLLTAVRIEKKKETVRRQVAQYARRQSSMTAGARRVSSVAPSALVGATAHAGSGATSAQNESNASAGTVGSSSTTTGAPANAPARYPSQVTAAMAERWRESERYITATRGIAGREQRATISASAGTSSDAAGRLGGEGASRRADRKLRRQLLKQTLQAMRPQVSKGMEGIEPFALDRTTLERLTASHSDWSTPAAQAAAQVIAGPVASAAVARIPKPPGGRKTVASRGSLPSDVRGGGKEDRGTKLPPAPPLETEHQKQQRSATQPWYESGNGFRGRLTAERAYEFVTAPVVAPAFPLLEMLTAAELREVAAGGGVEARVAALELQRARFRFRTLAAAEARAPANFVSGAAAAAAAAKKLWEKAIEEELDASAGAGVISEKASAIALPDRRRVVVVVDGSGDAPTNTGAATQSGMFDTALRAATTRLQPLISAMPFEHAARAKAPTDDGIVREALPRWLRDQRAQQEYAGVTRAADAQSDGDTTATTSAALPADLQAKPTFPLTQGRTKSISPPRGPVASDLSHAAASNWRSLQCGVLSQNSPLVEFYMRACLELPRVQAPRTCLDAHDGRQKRFAMTRLSHVDRKLEPVRFAPLAAAALARSEAVLRENAAVASAQRQRDAARRRLVRAETELHREDKIAALRQLAPPVSTPRNRDGGGVGGGSAAATGPVAHVNEAFTALHAALDERGKDSGRIVADYERALALVRRVIFDLPNGRQRQPLWALATRCNLRLLQWARAAPEQFTLVEHELRGPVVGPNAAPSDAGALGGSVADSCTSAGTPATESLRGGEGRDPDVAALDAVCRAIRAHASQAVRETELRRLEEDQLALLRRADLQNVRPTTREYARSRASFTGPARRSSGEPGGATGAQLLSEQVRRRDEIVARRAAADQRAHDFSARVDAFIADCLGSRRQRKQRVIEMDDARAHYERAEEERRVTPQQQPDTQAPTRAPHLPPIATSHTRRDGTDAAAANGLGSGPALGESSSQRATATTSGSGWYEREDAPVPAAGTAAAEAITQRFIEKLEDPLGRRRRRRDQRLERQRLMDALHPVAAGAGVELLCTGGGRPVGASDSEGASVDGDNDAAASELKRLETDVASMDGMSRARLRRRTTVVPPLVGGVVGNAGAVPVLPAVAPVPVSRHIPRHQGRPAVAPHAGATAEAASQAVLFRPAPPAPPGSQALTARFARSRPLNIGVVVTPAPVPMTARSAASDSAVFRSIV